jgi:hypothetical protein
MRNTAKYKLESKPRIQCSNTNRIPQHSTTGTCHLPAFRTNHSTGKYRSLSRDAVTLSVDGSKRAVQSGRAYRIGMGNTKTLQWIFPKLVAAWRPGARHFWSPRPGPFPGNRNCYVYIQRLWSSFLLCDGQTRVILIGTTQGSERC